MTVDAVLTVGAVNETIEVTAANSALQMNTSTMEMTMDRKMLMDLPIQARNPFTLALLNPAVVNRYFATPNPFFMWSSSMIDVGGNTSQRNEIAARRRSRSDRAERLVLAAHGRGAGVLGSAERVDAEFGHSAGGILSLGMKSGTNEFTGRPTTSGATPR